MNIKLNLIPSHDYNRVTVTPEEMNFTDKEWEDLTDAQKRDSLETFGYDLPEQPFWCFDSYEEIV